MRTNSLLLAAACTLPFSLVACGSSDSSSGDDDNENVTPMGDHHQYVVSKATVIASAPESIGLDLGGKLSSKSDGKVDNRLGTLLNTVAGVAHFDIQGQVDAAINDASLILLLDIQTTDFTNNTAGAGFSVKFGSNPRPAACTNPADPTTCGQHLKGTGMFDVSASSPADASINGKVINGVFNAGPGNVGLQIALAGVQLNLSLVHARAQATGVSADGVTSVKVGGLVTLEEVNSQLGPALKTAIDNIIARDCTGTPKTPANNCGCASGSTGQNVLSYLDAAPQDCMITLDEILTNPAVSSELVPDSCSKDACDQADSLSIGIQIKAVKATF